MEHNSRDSGQQGLSVSLNGQLNNENKRSSIVPPYWKRQRGDSSSTIGNAPATRITLEDHTEEPSDKSTALWAKSVTIEDYVVVSGSRTGVGAYVVWNCTVETLEVCLLSKKGRLCHSNTSAGCGHLRIDQVLIVFCRAES
jgi:hypothetical protein